MHKQLTVNPFEVFGVRRVEFPPAHFEYADITLPYNVRDALEKWVESNLKSRYYLDRSLVIDLSNKITWAMRIGFEDPKELSFFMLACPHLKYK